MVLHGSAVRQTVLAVDTGVKRSCHGGGWSGRPGVVEPVRVALLGMPNTGKSTLFNALTGGNAQIANWPGLTVELLRGSLPADREAGPTSWWICPASTTSAAAAKTRRSFNASCATARPIWCWWCSTPARSAVQLRLLLQLRALGLPLVVALNMSDEARRFGLRSTTTGLAAALGAAGGAGERQASQGIGDLLEAIRVGLPIGGRQRHGPASRSGWRWSACAWSWPTACVRLPAHAGNARPSGLDRVLLHPLVGWRCFLPGAGGVPAALWPGDAAAGGSGPPAGWGAEQRLLEPVLAGLGTPALLKSFLLDGVWLGVGTVATFMPLIFLFYVLIGVVEDSGYLPRAAFLMDGFMRWLGLDGRSFVLQVMGFGCNVPSIMGTRVIRDRGMRLLAMLCIPFALCQARLTVFVFLVGVFFPRPWWAPGLVLFGFYLLSFAAAIITGLLFKRVYPSQEAFVLELPPYRTPSVTPCCAGAGARCWGSSSPPACFIMVGAAAIWLLTHLPPGAAESGAGKPFAGGIGAFLHPLLGPIGLNPDLSVSLFFGFIAKEILLGALAVIYRTTRPTWPGACGRPSRPCRP